MRDILEQVIPIAKEAGNILLRHFEAGVQQDTKSSSIDIVTQADRDSEAYISRELMALFPDHHLVGEEGGGMGASIDTAEYHWYVDPLDGTVNFASGIPHWCVSLSLTDAKRNPLLAVIYEPTRGELYTAIKGEGAFLNGKPLQVSKVDRLVNAVVASGFAYDKHTNPDNNTAQWAAFVVRVRGMRRFGSAALDLAYIAAGRFDGYWERSLKPWDALGGMLLVTEAGGRVTDYRGGDNPMHEPDGKYLATNGHIHQLMLDVIKESYGWS